MTTTLAREAATVTNARRRKMSNRRGGLGAEILNLCFHGIGTPGRPLEPDEDLYWVKEEQFTELLEVISRYPSVRVTFDDGNASDAAIALPALRQHNLAAKFFIVADRIDQPGSVASADVRELVSGGMVIGSHGLRHRPWRSVHGDELHQELAVAASTIAEVSGQPVTEVACPFGSYDRRVLAAIRRTGFRRVYTVDGGPARSQAWIQPRYTVRAADTPADIERRARSPHPHGLAAAVRAGKSAVKRWR
jgi:peptidoglycan/xylan/chitin deacetylase (PgdA/CDA1 family)